MPNATQPALVRLREVFEVLGVSPDAGYASIRRGDFPIPVVKVGGVLKCRRIDVDAYTGSPAA
jgi:predicted DNA-binding transcriptional regulator AlpA